ncbi:hypothetical protein ABZ114_13190 [Streptomyces albidoflavus]|nr:hypothetical protein [Streptomyces sp. KE1]
MRAEDGDPVPVVAAQGAQPLARGPDGLGVGLRPLLDRGEGGVGRRRVR